MAYQPKSYRKFLAGSVSAALVATAVGPVVANAASFSDVNPNDSHAANINALVELGYIKGFADGTFKPYQSITRGQVAKIFARILTDQGFQAPDKIEQVFDDVPLDAKDQELVKAAAIVKAAGVMTGSQGKLNPAQNITREQMAKVLVEAFDLTKPADFTSKITDLDKADPSFRDYIQTLEANGVTVVTEYRPKDSVTRAAFASFVKRALDVSSVVTADDITAVKFVDENTLEVTFNGELKEVKKEDFAIEGVEIDSVSIKAAASAESKTTVVVIKTKTKLEEGKTYTISYKGKTTDKAKVEVPVVTPKVESVSAINAKTIEVKFNKAVDKSTAETKTNYTLTGANSDAVASLTIDKAELKDDKKTVVLTLSNALNSKTTAQYTVNIKNVNLEASTEKVPEFTSVLVLADAVAPTVTGISYPEANTAKVEFSEPINTTSSGLSSAVTVKLDGTTKFIPATAYTLAADKKSFTIDFTKTGLEYGKNYSITINGLTDFANNALTKFEGTLNFVQDVENPQVVSLTALDLRHLKVVFSEKIKDKNAIQVYVDNVLDSGATITDFDPSNPDGKTFVIRLSNAKSNGATHLIKLTSFQDKAGNPVNPLASNYIQAVTFNETAPALTNTVPTIKKFGNKVYAVLAFDRNVEVDGTPSVTLTYVDSNSVTRTTTATLIDNETEANLAANEVAIDITSFVTGSYTFDLPAGSVEDIYGNGVKLVKGLTFYHTEQLAEKSVVGVWINDGDTAEDTSLTAADGTTRTTNNDVVYVQFSGPVGPEALDVTKYTVDGVQVFEKAILDGSSDLVKLTLKDGAITSTGKKTFAVTGIPNVKDITIYKDQTTAQSVSSTAPYFDGSEFTENVKPVVESVKLVDLDKIQVKFSEDLNGATVQNADFRVKVDGTVVSTTAVEENGYVTLTLGTPVAADKVNKVTLEVLDTSDIADLNGNVVVPYAEKSVTVALGDLVAQAKVKLDAAFNLFEDDGTLKSGVTTGQLRSAVNEAKEALDAAGLTSSSSAYKTGATYAQAYNALEARALAEEAEDVAAIANLTVTSEYNDLFASTTGRVDKINAKVTAAGTITETKIAAILDGASDIATALTTQKGLYDAAKTAVDAAKASRDTILADNSVNSTEVASFRALALDAKTKIAAMDNTLANAKSLLTADINDYINAVKGATGFDFDLVGVSGKIQVSYAGGTATDVISGGFVAANGYTVATNPSTLTDITFTVATGAVSAVDDDTAGTSTITITDTVFGVSDTIVVNTDETNNITFSEPNN